MSRQKYLGDGIYVDFDGYQISISVNNHSNMVAFLDPQVVHNFKEYIKEIEKL
jgi:hypothetical protein